MDDQRVIVSHDEIPGSHEGQWRVEADRVLMTWNNGTTWRSLRLPLNTELTIGDDALGAGRLRASKKLR